MFCHKHIRTTPAPTALTTCHADSHKRHASALLLDERHSNKNKHSRPLRYEMIYPCVLAGIHPRVYISFCYRPHHPPHSVPVLPTAFAASFTCARQVIYQYGLATSSTNTGLPCHLPIRACHVIYQYGRNAWYHTMTCRRHGSTQK